MSFKKYFMFKFVELDDPSPESIKSLEKFLSVIMKYAEWVLVSGAFLFIASEANSIPISIFASGIAILLWAHILTISSTFKIFNIESANTKLGRIFILSLDAVLGGCAVTYIYIEGVYRIIQVLKTGVGI